MQIFYRANGGKNIGMGHLVRGGLIANFFKEVQGDSKCTFLIDEDAVSRDYLEKRSLSYISIPSSVTNEIDFLDEHLDVMLMKQSLLFLDVLETDQDDVYLSGLMRRFSSVVAITDDSNMREIKASLVLNGNPSQLNLAYKDEGKYLLGPKFFIMNTEIANLQAGRTNNKDVWLLTLGGSDHNDLIFRIIDVLESLNFDKKLLVAVSSASGYIKRLQQRLNASALNAELFVDLPNLNSLWEKVDFALTAGGNTLFERIAANCPGATICQLERQNEIANSFSSLGVNLNIGYAPDLINDSLMESLSNLLKNTSSISQAQLMRNRGVVDGRGLERLYKELKKRKIII